MNHLLIIIEKARPDEAQGGLVISFLAIPRSLAYKVRKLLIASIVLVSSNFPTGGETIEPATRSSGLTTIVVIADKFAQRLRGVFVAAHRRKGLCDQQFDFRCFPVGRR